MAGFQRFISYLYKYENDQRQENTGFAKVEIRGDSYRLEVHVRNLNLEKPDCTVYLFARKKEIMHAVPIGEMYIRRGNGDMRYVFEEKDLSGFGMKMDYMEGIFISVSEEIYIASQWKEGEIHKNNLHILKKGEMPEVIQEENRENFHEPANTRAKAENVPETKDTGTERENVRETVEAAHMETDNAPGAAGDVPEQAGNQGTEAKNSHEEGMAGEESLNEKEVKQEEKGKETENPGRKNLKATEIPLEKFLEDGDLEGAFQKLRLKLTVFYPFQGEDIECVKVDITDLQELPKKYWYLGKNSFLLHGFFNYRHLIIGEIKEEEKCGYFIGVPGVFQNQERIMATMFGFPEFRTAEQSEFKTGNFGYWYRVM